MKDERYSLILEMLKDGKYISTDELSRALYVSLPTIRRDLAALQQMGLVVRSRGGAVARSTIDAPPVSFRSGFHMAEKLKLASAASKFLRDDCTIFMDESSTTLHIIDSMINYKNIKVVTNSIPVINQLSKYNIETHCLGGQLDRDTMSFYGTEAFDELELYSIDIVFFSSSGICNDGQIVDYSRQATELRRKIFRKAAAKVFLCDKSKFGKRDTFVLCNLSNVDHIVVNAPLPEEYETGSARVIVVE